jgi:hypothetical protein
MTTRAKLVSAICSALLVIAVLAILDALLRMIGG